MQSFSTEIAALIVTLFHQNHLTGFSRGRHRGYRVYKDMIRDSEVELTKINLTTGIGGMEDKSNILSATVRSATMRLFEKDAPRLKMLGPGS